MNSRIHRIIGWSLREAILKFKKDENQSSELLEKKSVKLSYCYVILRL